MAGISKDNDVLIYLLNGIIYNFSQYVPTFSRKIEGLFFNREIGARNGEQALEDRFRFEPRLRQDLVDRHVEDALTLDGQRRRLAPFVEPELKSL
jgi:hypothetical protein